MKFKVGDRVRNTLKEDNFYIRAGDTGIVEVYDEDDTYRVKWDKPKCTDCNGSWWIEPNKLEAE